MIKNILPFIIAITLAGGIQSGCKSSEPSDQNAPRDINYSQYDTYNFGEALVVSSENPAFAWPQFTQRVKREISFVLPPKGLDRTSSEPDLIIYFYALVQSGKDYPMLPYEIGWAAEPFITNGESLDRYGSNTFFIDFVDANNKQLIWRGSTTLPYHNEQKLYEVLPKRIHALLQPYPQLPS